MEFRKGETNKAKSIGPNYLDGIEKQTYKTKNEPIVLVTRDQSRRRPYYVVSLIIAFKHYFIQMHEEIPGKEEREERIQQKIQI